MFSCDSVYIHGCAGGIALQSVSVSARPVWVKHARGSSWNACETAADGLGLDAFWLRLQENRVLNVGA